VEILKKVMELSEKNIRFALVTIVDKKGSGPRGIGSRMVVLEDGRIFGSIGGGQLEGDVIGYAIQQIRTGEPIFKKIDLLKDVNSICGGSLSILIEPFKRRNKLWFFGGGHVAKALYDLAKSSDFNIAVVEDRKEMLIEERFPGTEMIHVDSPADAVKSGKLPINNGDMVLVFTRSHDMDYSIMVELLKLDVEFSYFGLIGSRNKLSKNFSKALEEGVKREKLEKLYAPVGLDIGGETPTDIAISILAELLMIKNNRSGKHLRDITELDY